MLYGSWALSQKVGPQHPPPHFRAAWSEPMLIGWASSAPASLPPPPLTLLACSSSLGDRGGGEGGQGQRETEWGGLSGGP